MTAATAFTPDTRPSTLTKVAVVPVSTEAGPEAIEVALARTARGHWGLLEGWAINGVDELDALRRVARDGVGSVGSIDPVPIGAYLVPADRRSPFQPCIVNVFVMHTTRSDAASLCEWLSLEKAAELVADGHIASLIEMAGALIAEKCAALDTPAANAPR